MFLLPVNEIVMHGVFDRGIPNQERIVLRTQTQINTAPYGLLVAAWQNESALPIPDQFFWFGETILDAGTWIYVYSCKGFTRYTKTMGSNEPAYVLHWNRDNIIFGQSNLYPTLIRMDACSNGKPDLANELTLLKSN